MSDNEVIPGKVYSKKLRPTGHNANALSVIIIAFNEERNIGRCIDSVIPVADEIIVLDSYSTDDTVAIARSKGAIVKQASFTGHIQQKNRALQLSSNNFVLSLDADEALDQQLTESILAIKKNFTSRAYKMNRCTNYCGRFIRYGLWYPDRKVRLFDKRVATWGGVNPHDKIILTGNTKVVHLKGDILHYSYNTIAEHQSQNNYFSSISAKALYEKGKRFKWWKILVNPLWSFVNGYILRGGFVDGIYGFIIAIHASHYTFLKYIKLYHLHKAKKKSKMPVPSVGN
jgi:glycosyltransferase involved in cell wall biosynthesis